MSEWWRGTRGEWYVVVQFGLFGLVALGPRAWPGWPSWPTPLGRGLAWVGAVLMIVGAGLLLAATHRLGRSLTALPAPKPDSELVSTGPYALVRHPIYAAAILLAVGWALVVNGTLTLVYGAVLAWLLDRKATREERWLADRYPSYPAYRNRVRKLIPFLY